MWDHLDPPMRRLAYRGLTLANAQAFGHSCGHMPYPNGPVRNFQIDILQSAGSGRNPAVFYDLYRHTFLKDCGSHDKKTPARALDRAHAPSPGDGRKGVMSGPLVLVENGPFRGWPMGGSFSATAYGHLIPYPYLERDFRLFKARVWSSDSTGQDRVVPRNFIVGSGSNGCNNFPPADRPPLHPPWLLL